MRVCRFRHSRESHYIIQHFFRFVNRFFKTFLDFFRFFEKTQKIFHFSIDFYIKLWYNTPWICFKSSRRSNVWSMPKSKIYLKSKHRLGSSPRVKIEGAQKQVWRNGRRAGFRFQWRDSCGFKSRHLHQTKRAYPCDMLFLFYEGGGFEIGRKLRCNLCEAPNSLNDCLSAKAATGGNPVTCTKKRL